MGNGRAVVPGQNPTRSPALALPCPSLPRSSILPDSLPDPTGIHSTQAGVCLGEVGTGLRVHMELGSHPLVAFPGAPHTLKPLLAPALPSWTPKLCPVPSHPCLAHTQGIRHNGSLWACSLSSWRDPWAITRHMGVAPLSTAGEPREQEVDPEHVQRQYMRWGMGCRQETPLWGDRMFWN